MVNLKYKDILEIFVPLPKGMLLDKVRELGQLEYRRGLFIDNLPIGLNKCDINISVMLWESFNGYAQLKKEVNNMIRWTGIGKRNKKQGLLILPLEEAKQISFEDIYNFKGIKKNRGGFSAVCPLHSEKTGSFNVRNNKFKCFGCGKGGSTIDFIMELQGLNFVDAVKHLTGIKNDKVI